MVSRWTPPSTRWNTTSACVLHEARLPDAASSMEKTLTPGEVLALYPPHADTIPTLLASRASVLPTKVALEFESRHWTYAALDEVSTLLAHAAVQRGVNKGDRIAVVSVNTDLSIIVFLAAAKAGDRKSTRLNSSHLGISYAVFCLKKKKKR